jgi:asparagine synthase (glutamine-hydrolysing)
MLPALFGERVPRTIDFVSWYRWLRAGAGLPALWKEYREAAKRPANRTCFFSCDPDYEEARNELPGYYTAAYREALGETDPGRLFSTEGATVSLEVLFTTWICESYLRENGVAQGDRLSMASSVELRLPLLDHKFVETVVGLRKARSDAQLPPKALLRAALAGILPDTVMARPKRGFEPPVREWYRELFRHYGPHLEEGWLVANGVLNPQGARELARGRPVPGTVHPLAFKALVLEEWSRGMSQASS